MGGQLSQCMRGPLLLSTEVDDVRIQLPAGPYLCILGGTSFKEPISERIVTAIATKIKERLDRRVTVLTGGMQGVQFTFAAAVGDDFKSLVNLVPMGQASNFGVGRDVIAGGSLQERMDIFAQIGDAYLSIEGGPGVAKEALAASERGAFVLPVITTGGASAGLFDFPPAALERPADVLEETWAAIRDGKDADVVASAVVDILDVKLSGMSSGVGAAEVKAGLAELLRDHPYLDSTVAENIHPLVYWVRQCRSKLNSKNYKEAAASLEAVKDGLETEKRQITAAFRRFDADNSGKIESGELTFLCGYLGWNGNVAKKMDLNADGLITEYEFIRYVGTLGGMSNLFQERRRTVEARQFARFETQAISVGSRVRSFFYYKGQKSKEPQEAQILQVRVKGQCPDAPYDGVMLAFGFGQPWTARQVVPPYWILPDAAHAATVAALRECGIMDEQQAFWASVYPASELRAVERLTDCQRKALSIVRAVSSEQHEKALPLLRGRYHKLGFGEEELQATLHWIQDLAPMCIHIHIDTVGRFLESDNFYRSQFETGTSCGALDNKNQIRKDWERELFGGAYDNAKPFERCKYGALSVMNDYRGVTSAYQYGDSYLVLKDVRLRCSFASTDSGGLEGNRLAVHDKYSHVLNEYTNEEIRALVKVAMAAKEPPQKQDVMKPELLRGTNMCPSHAWVTLGFPSLGQRKGCFYFEIHLDEGCKSPQVGLLCTHFSPHPYVTEKANLGVGDDWNGWAVDGQHATRWKRGQKKVWNVYWESKRVERGHALTQKVIVGIAADLDDRKVWICSNGVWDERPAFEGSDIPTSLCLYPAASVRGGGAFNFGIPSQPVPSVPPKCKKTFLWWPSPAGGISRMDCPLVGDSDVINIYKEIQVHGEVNLRRNVQRLVANRKHLECPKQDRSWALTVVGTGTLDGSYYRHGAYAERPTFMNDAKAMIYYHPRLKQWCLSETEDFESWSLAVPVEDEESFEPPRTGWKPTLEHQGVASAEAFKAAMASMGISSTDIDNMVAALSGGEPDGPAMVYRAKPEASFTELYEKLPKKPRGVADADAAWGKVVDEVKASLLKASGFPQGTQVVETKHPYPNDAIEWHKTVTVEGAKELAVQFTSNTRTMQYYSTFDIDSAGLAQHAQKGLRVQFASLGAEDYAEQFRGTMIEHEGDLWKVKVDRQEVEDSGRFSDAAPETGDILVTCADEQDVKSVVVRYEDGVKVSDEIGEFALLANMPFTPFCVKGFKTNNGPAQQAGVAAGWYLDIAGTLFGEHGMGHEVHNLLCNCDDSGGDLGPMPEGPWDAELYCQPELLFKRLVAVKGATNISLVFVNALKAKVLPQAFAAYPPDRKVGDEIEGFCEEDEDEIIIEGFIEDGGDNFVEDCGEGPAQRAGVQPGWRLRIDKTLGQKEGAPKIKKEELLENPNALLEMMGVTLIFEPDDLDEPHYFSGSGCEEEDWEAVRIPGGGAKFSFKNCGVGAGSVEERWGVFALVTPLDQKGSEMPVSKETLDKFADEWTKAVGRAIGFTAADEVIVEAEDWDEQRLRRLCARHGWDFEWMTEDGERLRRAGLVQSSATKHEGDKSEAAASVAHAQVSRPDGSRDLKM